MRERSIQAQEESQKQFEAYVRQAGGGTSTADEVAKLGRLRDDGTISAEEFERQKAKLLA
jgi:hypothetical protein